MDILAGKVFANGSGGRVSIPGRVIPKTQKMVRDAAFLNTQHYKEPIKGKVKQSRKKRVTPSPTSRVVDIKKSRLRVALNYDCQLYFTNIHTYT